AAPWFSNVAGPMGLADQVNLRCKLIDLTGDGWPDALITGNGDVWRKAFLERNKLPDGLPKDADGKYQIAKADWPGEAADFALIDFDKDGTITADEFNAAVQMNTLTLLVSVPDPDHAGSRKFEDRTAASGLRTNHERSARGRLTMVTVAGDVDNDGDVDLFAGTYVDAQNPANKVPDVGDRSCLLINDGAGTFTPLIQAIAADQPTGPNAQPSTVCAACLVDVNNDGVLDLFTGSWYVAYGASNDAMPDRLYIGLGDGRYNDITAAAGMMLDASAGDRTGEPADDWPAEKKNQFGRHSHRPAYGVAHADADGDGDQDLFVMAYGRQWNLQWTNGGAANGKPTFKEVAEATGFDGDSDRTGRYEQWVKDMFKQRGYGDRPDELPFRSNGNTFSCCFGDYNNDGRLDAVLGEITHAWAGPSSDRSQVLTNLGGPDWKWRRETPLAREHVNARGWNQGDMHVAFADMDNDGWLDVLLASSDYPDEQRLRLFRQNPETHAFEDVTAKIGLDWAFATQFSLADVDRDGDLDILIGNTHTRLPGELRAKYPLGTALLRNDICNANGHHFLSLRLVGAGPEAGGCNVSAIGARIIVTAGGITQTREISGGGGHVGQQHDFRQIIGLGKAQTIDRLEVRWPGKNHKVTVLQNVAVDKLWRLDEADGELKADVAPAIQKPD
ncbi:MAG: CRTAC1 family protein, partial [Planctomycetota bacterium]